MRYEEELMARVARNLTSTRMALVPLCRRFRVGAPPCRLPPWGHLWHSATPHPPRRPPPVRYSPCSPRSMCTPQSRHITTPSHLSFESSLSDTKDCDVRALATAPRIFPRCLRRLHRRRWSRPEPLPWFRPQQPSPSPPRPLPISVLAAPQPPSPALEFPCASPHHKKLTYL